MDADMRIPCYTFGGVLFLDFIIPKKDYLVLVREQPLGRKRGVFEVSDPRADARVRPAGRQKTTRGSCWLGP